METNRKSFSSALRELRNPTKNKPIAAPTKTFGSIVCTIDRKVVNFFRTVRLDLFAILETKRMGLRMKVLLSLSLSRRDVG